MSAPGAMLGFIVSDQNGKVLDVQHGRAQAGSKVILYPKKDPPSPNQLWYTEPCGNGYFFIVSELNRSMCMDVENASSEAGTDICLWDKK